MGFNTTEVAKMFRVCSGTIAKILHEDNVIRASGISRGTKFSDERKRKMSEKAIGHKCSEETKRKISIANLGEKNGMFGKKHFHTEETKKKIGDANRGRNYTKEMKRNMSEAHKGKKLGIEHKLKISKALKGRIMSEETKLKLSESRKGRFKGEECNNWRGGVSFLPYCPKFDNEFRERVRKFFDRKCYLCDKDEIENGAKLCVHHVNYDKMTCCNDTKPLFVPLCRVCHAKTGYNRKYWEDFFTISLEYLTDSESYLREK